MKLNKIITKALLAITAVAGFASCSSDDYEMASVPGNGQVYFSNVASSEILLEENQNKVEVEVKRVKTDGELTVNVQTTDASGLFTAASNVTFAAGESTAKLPISFDFSKLESDKDYPVTLKLLGDTCSYGDNSITVNIKYAPWTEWKEMGGGDVLTYTYKTYVSGEYEQPTYFRVSMLNENKAQLKLEDWFYGVDLIVDWDKSTNELTVSPQFSGYVHSSYGSVYVADAYTYYTQIRGKEVPYENYRSYYDEEKGQFCLNLSYYVSAGSFGNDYEILQLPGYTQSDYSINIEDGGSYKSGKKLGQVFNITMGSDLSSLKYAVFAGTLSDEEITEKANGIFSGEIESTSTSESGYKLELVDAEGDYTLIAIGYDADSKWQATEAIEFTVKSPEAEKTWKAISTGDYEYTLLFGTEDEPETDAGLTLYQCNEDPTLYKIEHWGYDVDFMFTMDESGKVEVLDQETGCEHPNYGMIMVGEAANYNSKYSKYSSSYDSSTGTFSFGIAYYVEAGPMVVGYETFTINNSSSARSGAHLRKVKVSGKKVTALANKKTVSKFALSRRAQRIMNNKTLH